MKQPSKLPASKPSLEALLRLKRAERPDEAFWSDFEVRMRQKQLAAIIEPKPWWLGASLALRKFSFPALAVTSGAAALFAVTVVRNDAPFADGGLASVSVAVQANDLDSSRTVAALAAVPARSDVPVALGSPVETAPDSFTKLPERAEARVPVAAATPSVPVASADAVDAALGTIALSAAALLAGLDSPAPSSSDAIGAPAMFALSPEAFAAADANADWRVGGVSLAALEFADLNLVRSESFAFNLYVSVASVRAPEVDASEAAMSVAVAPAPGSRFARLLADDAPKVASNPEGALAQVRDRVLHHLGREDDLYASVSRLGVGGDRLSLRF